MSQNQDYVSQQSDFSSVISLFKYGQGNYKKLWQSIALILISTVMLMASAKLMGELAESLISDSENQDIYSLIAWIIAFETLHIGIYYQGRVGLAHVTNQVALGIRKALFRKLGRLPISYFDKEPLGRTMTRLTSDVEGVESFFSNTMPRFVTALITITSVLGAMLATDLHLGAIVVASSLPAVIFTVALRSPVRHWLREYKKRSAALNSRLAEYINGLAVIRILGIESWTGKQFNKGSKDLYNSAISLMNWNSFIRPLAALFCAVPILIILWYGGHKVLEGSVAIGLLVTYIRYGERYFRPVMMLSFELHLIQDAIASSERIRVVLDEFEEDTVLGTDGQHQGRIKGAIEFECVKMEYKKDQEVLKGISFHVKPGESVALVGQTGSGKTTTIQLLPQLYNVKSGNIIIDNIPIESWSRKAIREQIGIVNQDVSIFHGTIRENLLIARNDNQGPIDENTLRTYCRRTGLLEILENMPKGLDTMCLDNGNNLSMGERQLIAFTRMLIRNPSILVLDEATSNIDEGYEALIQKTTKEVLKGRTTFIIAHRLNTIRDCDKILVFDQGQIVEQGTHEQLMKKADGTYANLVSRQLDEYY